MPLSATVRGVSRVQGHHLASPERAGAGRSGRVGTTRPARERSGASRRYTRIRCGADAPSRRVRGRSSRPLCVGLSSNCTTILLRTPGRSLDMRSRILANRGLGSAVLVATIVVLGGALAAWKSAAARAPAAAAASQPEPVEAVTIAIAGERRHRATTTAIGTVLALRSITLRTELAGTVRDGSLTPRRIVDPGA